MLILAALLLLMVVWIILPPPSRSFWLWTIGVGEWSLWFGAAAAVYAAAAVLIRLYEGHGWLWLPTAVIAVAALAITLYPLLSILPLARETTVSLSLRRYFRGLPARDYFFAPSGKEFTTHSYADTHGDGALLLDVYLPTAKTENNGASIIVVHGGSWNGGTAAAIFRAGTAGFATGDLRFLMSITVCRRSRII